MLNVANLDFNRKLTVLEERIADELYREALQWEWRESVKYDLDDKFEFARCMHDLIDRFASGSKKVRTMLKLDSSGIVARFDQRLVH